MFLRPAQVVAQLKCSPGEEVADFGAGSGFYTTAVAKAVGPWGRVYAIDIQRALLERLRKEAEREHLTNIDFLWGDLEKEGGSHLGPASVDAVMVSNILFQLQHKDVFAQEVVKVLKSGGRVLIVDWRDSFKGMGPEKEQVVGVSEARTLFEKVGLRFERTVEAGLHHYGMIFRKA